MKPFRSLSAIEQLADHLRAEILRGTLNNPLPGVHRLAAELGVSPKTVVAAVAQLEHEGLLLGQGPRKRYRIIPRTGRRTTSSLRVSILPYEAGDRMQPYMIQLQHRLEESGHRAEFTRRSLSDLGQHPDRVTALVEKTAADAWIVLGGSRAVLERFAAGTLPAFALFGRRRALPIAGAGPDKREALRQAIRRLVGMGHRRIVLLARAERRKPLPGALERAFLEELETHGIRTGAYHLPDWDETPEGFERCLDRMFDLTPPTALILDEAFFLTVAQQHLARRGILAPEHVSLICSDPDPSFAWFLPRIAHIRWDPRPVTRRILRWVEDVAHGRDHRRQTLTKAHFVEGGTIGPAQTLDSR